MSRIAICVPVRNERAALPLLLAALLRQSGEFTVCLYFDGCTDGSEEVARAAAGSLPLRIGRRAARTQANAGRARKAAMALGVEAVGGSGLLLTTDADSAPAADWVARARFSLADCDMVTGRIERERAEADPALGRLEAYYDRLYAYRRMVDPVAWEVGSGHHYTAGANLGVRAEVYRALGGFPELPAGEDATLTDMAMRAGYRVRRDPTLLVRTSARRKGRAQGGLADMLRRIDTAGEAGLTVGDPAAVAWQYHRHARARAAFPLLPERSVAGALGLQLGLTGDHVAGVARDCPNAEAFAMRIVPASPNGHAELSLAEAERVLSILERTLLEQAA